MSAGGHARAGLPRLLSAIPAHGAMSFSEHLALHGEAPLARGRRARRESAALIEQVEQAGLLGRGGGAFPTSLKMRAVAKARGHSIVVVNATEGEPASRKDRTLLQALPHLVLDGGLLATQAVDADRLIVCAPASATDSLRSLRHAIAERRHAGEDSAAIELVGVPDRYVAGQESALVNHLNGGPAIPTFTPPLPLQRGVRRRPTLVSNGETLAHVALIARHGPRWFRELGTHAQPGSALVTLSGPVAYPGVYEIEHGASLSSLIDAAGGSTAAIRAGLFGGYAGTWIGAEQMEGVTLCNEQLALHGASIGAGVLALLSSDACGVAETARVARWLAEQSAGQCGPCVNGLPAIARAVEDLAQGCAQAHAEQRIARLASLTRRRGACAHPDGAVRFVLSALQVLGPEFADHAVHGPCEACERHGELPLPNAPQAIATPA